MDIYKVVSRTKEKLEQVADELKQFNVTVLVCQCDVSKKDQVKEMMEDQIITSFKFRWYFNRA